MTFQEHTTGQRLPDILKDFDALKTEWFEGAEAMRGGEQKKAGLWNTCTIDLCKKHLVGFRDPVSAEEALAHASKVAKDRTTNESTVVNLSQAGDRVNFEQEVAGAADKKSLTTANPYPVIHIERNEKACFVGRATVTITRDAEGNTLKRFNHFAGIATWSPRKPAADKWK